MATRKVVQLRKAHFYVTCNGPDLRSKEIVCHCKNCQLQTRQRVRIISKRAFRVRRTYRSANLHGV